MTYDHSKCPAMPRKSWQEEYIEEYEMGLAERQRWQEAIEKGRAADRENFPQDYVEAIDAKCDKELVGIGAPWIRTKGNSNVLGVGQISRDDYEVQ